MPLCSAKLKMPVLFCLTILSSSLVVPKMLVKSGKASEDVELNFLIYCFEETDKKSNKVM